MGKSKEISQDLRKIIVDLHKSGSSLGAISKRLKVPRSSVQTIIRKYKQHGTTQPSYRSGRRCVLSPTDVCTLVRKVQLNHITTAKDHVKMLKETGTKVSISTVKRVLHRHNLKAAQQGRSHCSKTANKKQTPVCSCTWGQRSYFWRNVLWSDKTKIQLFGLNDHSYVSRKKGDACKPKNTIPTMKHGVAASCCEGALL